MRKVLFFLGILDDSDIEWLISEGSLLKVGAGVSLIHEGQPLDSMFLVIAGSFAVTVAALGDQAIARLMSGETVGEMSVVDSRPPSASVKALEPSVVLSIQRRKLADRLARDMPFGARFYRALAVFLANRLRTTSRHFGYEREPPSDQAAETRDELDSDLLDSLSSPGPDSTSFSGAWLGWAWTPEICATANYVRRKRSG